MSSSRHKLSREKGKVFERGIARNLREAMPGATVRRSQQAHRAYEPDLVIEGNAPLLAKRLWLELTDSRAPSPLDKLAQAERDTSRLSPTGYPLPIVVWHKTGGRSVQATMRLATLVEVMGMGLPLGPNWAGLPVTVDWQQVLARLRELAGSETPRIQTATEEGT